MTFLAPMALIGALLLILPIVVHLFKPRKMQSTPFSSLRWLKLTKQRLSRRIQWHQWLLFLMRAACILLLVMALAKPLVGGWGKNKPVTRFIVIDGGASMLYQAGDDLSSFAKATQLATLYAKNYNVGDLTSILLSGPTPELITPLGPDSSLALEKINSLHPTSSHASLTATLPLIRSLIRSNNQQSVELVFLTDNLKDRWEQKRIQTFLKDLPNPVAVKLIETTASPTPNKWIANARLLQFGTDEDRIIRAEVSCNVEPTGPVNIILQGISGVVEESQPVTLKPGQVTRIDFRIPAALNLKGQIATLNLEPSDGLKADDSFFLNLDTPWAARVLLVEPDVKGADGRSDGLYLRVGMEVLRASKNLAIEVLVRNSGTVSATDFQNADVILMAGVPELTSTSLEALETRVRTGAGLAVLFGPHINEEFYNQKLYRPQQPAEGILPLPLKIEAQKFTLEGKPGRMTNISWNHPLLALLKDPLLGDLTTSRFNRYANLSGTIDKSDRILARFDDNIPAILERTLGAGRIIILNMSANDEWTDLPSEKKIFIPLLDRLLNHLASGALKQSFYTGNSIDILLPNNSPKDDVMVVSPTGVKLSPRLITLKSQTLLHLDTTLETGFYRVETSGKNIFTFAVNASRQDSSLDPMETPALEQWWSPAMVEVVSSQTAKDQLSKQSGHWAIWPILVFIAGVLLIMETIYVHHLCPNANPKSARPLQGLESTTRSLFKPAGNRTL